MADDVKQSRPTVEKVWQWDCDKKADQSDPCKSDPIFLPPTTPPPDKCNGTPDKSCDSDTFRKTAERLRVNKDGSEKILSSDGKQVIKESKPFPFGFVFAESLNFSNYEDVMYVRKFFGKDATYYMIYNKPDKH